MHKSVCNILFRNRTSVLDWQGKNYLVYLKTVTKGVCPSRRAKSEFLQLSKIIYLEKNVEILVLMVNKSNMV